MKGIQGVSKTVYYISFPLSFIAFILPVYASDLGSSPMEIGILYSIVSLCSILIRPVVGKWIDKRGRRSGVIIGVLAYTIAVGLYLIASSYSFILIARVVQSTGASFLWVSINAMIADISRDSDRAKNFGMIEQYSSRGSFIGSGIGFSLMFFSNSDNRLQLVFLVFLLIAAYALINSLRNTEETINTREENIKEEFENKDQFLKYIVIMGVLSAISTVMAPVYLVYLRETITRDLALISFLFVPGAVLSMFLPSKIGKLSDRIGRKRMLSAGMFLSGIFVVLIPLVTGYYAFMGLYTLMEIAGMISSPAEGALVAEITGGNHSGKAYGSYRLATGIGGVIGPLVGTVVYQYLGRGAIFYIEGAALLAASIIIWVVVRDKRDMLALNSHI